ncbi:bone morphogenetic protein 10-like [Chrysoperla carnea]|uniref:bone morphogenetic protein 10-like n=1 Tax=Chrysoperla carnea TaxID=189513 RepID=UPI001D079523|nr:bone morphogenetic protein 10-like [Chrysoperla carnea]
MRFSSSLLWFPSFLLIIPVMTKKRETEWQPNSITSDYQPGSGTIGGSGSDNNNTVTNITVQLGASAFLHCHVMRQADRAILSGAEQVSWVRRRDWHILSSGMFVYTNDERFQVLHAEGSDDWTLQIKYVQKRDNGTYECQIATGSGILSHFVNLNIVIPEAYILGSGEHHVDVGSVIRLVCIIENSPTPPQYVFWYHNDHMINYDVARGGISVETDPGLQTQSRLTIRDARDSDSGNYTCSASNTEPASIHVFVSEGDKMAAILRRKSSNGKQNNSSTATTVLPNNNQINMISTKLKPKFYIPKYMLDLYEESRIIPQNEILLKNHPDIVKSIIPTNAVSFTNISFPNFNNEKSHLLIFDVPVTNVDEIFLAAELRILSIIQHHPNSFLGIERLIHVSFYDSIEENIIHLDKKHIYHTNNTWISFNLTEAIRHILITNYNNTTATQQLRIVITIESIAANINNNEAFNLSLLPSADKYHYDEHDYPLLVLSYASKAHHHTDTSTNADQQKRGYQYQRQRDKRETDFIEDEYEEETNHLWNDQQSNNGGGGGGGMKPAQFKRMRRLRNTCKRQSLYINFADINYDSWIIQPTGYEAYQCSGKCFYPVADHLSPTKHAIIQALLHSVHPRKTPRTCCVPTKLGPISVLYVDSNGIFTYRYAYQEMVVLDCGCR